MDGSKIFLIALIALILICCCVAPMAMAKFRAAHQEGLELRGNMYFPIKGKMVGPLPVRFDIPKAESEAENKTLQQAYTPTQPTPPTQPTQPTQHTQPTQPTQSTQSTQPTQPTQSAASNTRKHCTNAPPRSLLQRWREFFGPYSTPGFWPGKCSDQAFLPKSAGCQSNDVPGMTCPCADCNDTHMPVCGIDAKTYFNECCLKNVARKQKWSDLGVKNLIKHSGPCEKGEKPSGPAEFPPSTALF